MAANERTGEQQAATGGVALQNFKDSLKKHNCLDDFQSLVKVLKGCSEAGLMYMVLAVRLGYDHHSAIGKDPSRMDKRKLDTWARKTRSVARALEKQFQTAIGQEVVKFAAGCDLCSPGEYLNIPWKLQSLVRWRLDIHQGSEHQRRPLYDDNLAYLDESVKLATGAYYDEEVSALVCWAIRADSYSAN